MLVKTLWADGDFWKKLSVIALPLVLQEAVNASINLIDSMMIGSFGDTSLAAINLCNSFFYLFRMVIYGMVSGGSVLNAQFWGKRDTRNIHRVMGMQIIGASLVGIVFSLLVRFIPQRILGFYSADSELITMGAEYLYILAPTYLFYAIGMVFIGVLRCTGNTRVTMRVSVCALVINLFLNWVFIFGNLGAPRMGIKGAAYATFIARSFEFLALISYSYLRNSPAAIKLRSMVDFQRDLTMLMIKKMLPVLINETVWGLGTNIYQVIYAQISTAAIAGFSATAPIDSIAFIAFFAIGDGCGIIIGNTLGAGDAEKAHLYGRYSIFLTLSLGILVGGVVAALRRPLLSIYNLSPEARKIAEDLMILVGGFFWLRCVNYTIIIGCLRAGGDTVYCAFMDLLPMWLVGVPLAYVLASWLGLSMFWVYMGRITEELIKFGLGYSRFRSKKWLNVLT